MPTKAEQEPKPNGEANIPVLVDIPRDLHPGPLIPSSLGNLYTTLSRPTSACLPPLNTNLPVRFNKHKLQPPMSLERCLMGDLRSALQKCFFAVGPAVRGLKFLHREKDQRYRRLCPVDKNGGRFYAHSDSVLRLRVWRENYGSRHAITSSISSSDSAGGFGITRKRALGSEYNDGPALAPTAKIPYLAMRLHCRREAYEAWAEKYATWVGMFRSGRYGAYCTAKAEFEEALRATKEGETDFCYSRGVLYQVQEFWVLG